MEIVSRPDIRSAEQAKGYVTELRAVLEAIGVSDVKMEEGSMRVDANVSVRPAGSETLGTRAEIKNMNSVRSLGRAIEYEIARQIETVESGGRVVQETRHWDEAAGITHGMRSKEGSEDYRYFPEPDLVPVAPTAAMRDSARAAVGELPAARRTRFVDDVGRQRDRRPDAAREPRSGRLRGGRGAPRVRRARTSPTGWRARCSGHLNETGLSPAVLPFPPDALAELVGLVGDGTLSRNLAKDVLAEGLRDGKRPRAIVADRGLAQVSDEGELGALVDDVLGANAAAVEEYRSGDDKLRKKKRGFLMGEVMKATKGSANPQVLNRLLDEALS